MQLTTIPIRYVSFILQSAERHGYDTDSLLASANIAPALLLQEKARISADDYHQFAQSTIFLMQDEYCGFLPQPARIGTFEMMTQACINCDSLGAFIERSARFQHLLGDALQIELQREDDLARYVLRPSKDSQDPDHFLCFVLLSIAQRLFSWVIGQPLLLDSVDIAHQRPGYAHEYNFLFRTSIRFKQSDFSLNFPARYLDLPNVQDQRTLTQLLKTPGMQLMSISSSDNSLVMKVLSMIRDHVSGDFPEFETIASDLCMTTATLRRRLREEGSSYRQIKDDIRRDVAIFNLGKSGMTVEQVAESVGFSEATSFFRAFKRWTGVTPRVYVKATSEHLEAD
ncbi:MAG: AraC family transcriptional regulator [Pseudomonadota bacterium]